MSELHEDELPPILNDDAPEHLPSEVSLPEFAAGVSAGQLDALLAHEAAQKLLEQSQARAVRKAALRV